MEIYINKKFGKLLVLTDPIVIKEPSPNPKNYPSYRRFTLCLCDCDNIIIRCISNLNDKSSCKECYKAQFPLWSTHGKWTIIEYIDGSKIKCRCNCGSINDVFISNLYKGNSLQCKKCQSVGLRENLEGRQFKRLVIKEYSHSDKNGHPYWVCRCNCPNQTIKIIKASSLKSGRTTSCGCFAKEQRKIANGGPNNKNWNPNLTQEDRESHWYGRGEAFHRWSFLVKKRDGFKCQKCGCTKSNLISHHIHGWSQYKDLRYDLDNGVCLCEKCHISFHTTYGFKDFTPKDFIEYLRDI